jgi:galactose mutarotase-like enzyme
MNDAALPSVRLTDEEAALEATFVPAAGMLCSSLRHRGQELLAQNDGVEAYAHRGKTMGIPLLYPWANRLADFSYEVAERAVEVPHDPSRIAVDQNGLPIHGVIGGRMEWELRRKPEPGRQSLAASLTWSESAPELFEVFPFSHELRYDALLDRGRLEVEISIHACGADSVPLAFGFHPYFSLPGVPRERWLIELPAMRHLALDANQIPVGPERALAAERFELASREFDDGFDSVAEPARFSVAAGRRIEIEFLEGFPCAQVFAPLARRASGSLPPGERQFICFEPMTAPANALRSGMGLRVLDAGERYRARFSVQVADFGAGRGRAAHEICDSP